MACQKGGERAASHHRPTGIASFYGVRRIKRHIQIKFIANKFLLIQDSHVRIVRSRFNVLVWASQQIVSEIVQSHQASSNKHPPSSAGSLKFLQVLGLMHVSLTKDDSLGRFGS